MSVYSELVVSHGASSYWRLGETSGTTAIDVVGGKNGTISGGVTLNQPGALAEADGAMVFDGSTGKISTVATVTIPVDATIEAWVKSTYSAAAQRPILTLGSSQAFAVHVATTKTFGLYCSGGVGLQTGVRVLADGVWSHVVCVVTATTVSFYVNGVLDFSTAYTRVTPATAIAHIGHDPAFGAAASGFWLDTLDEVAIYPLALTPTQIAAHYDIGIYNYTKTVGGRDTNSKLQAYLVAGSTDLTTDVVKNLATRSGEMTARMKKIIKDAGASN